MKGVTVQPGRERAGGGITRRVISALVLGPPVLAAIHVGPPWFDLLVAGAAAIMAWEWIGLCRQTEDRPAVAVLAVALVVAVAAAAEERMALSVAAVFAGMALTTAAVRLRSGATARPDGAALVVAVGALYLGLACVAVVWLRGQEGWGRAVTLWLFAVVWAVDTGAFAFGRWLGGPRLVPTISPSKTWAGLLGGVACAGLVGAATAGIVDRGALGRWVVSSAALGVAAQAGDLAESWVKRRFGAKDSSRLIPGHGGLLDRVDGLLAAALVLAAALGAFPRGVGTWR